MQQVVPEGVELAAVARLADLSGLRLLEIGAGDGRLTFQLARDAAFVLATDPADDSISTARARLPSELGDKVAFQVAGAASLDVEPEAFDGAFFTWSLC